MNQEERKAYLRKVAEKIQKQKEEDAKTEKAYYEKLTSGTRWKIFTAFTLFCGLLAILITVDTFVDGKVEAINQNQYQFNRSIGAWDHQSVWVSNNDLFIIPFEKMIGINLNSFEITYSYIFGDYKYLSFLQEYEDTVTPLQITRHYAQKRLSIYDWFPIVQVLLLLPFLVFLFKQQKPWFKFAQFLCFLLIFPGSLILLYTLVF